jgi:hypothetical protein
MQVGRQDGAPAPDAALGQDLRAEPGSQLLDPPRTERAAERGRRGQLLQIEVADRQQPTIGTSLDE